MPEIMKIDRNRNLKQSQRLVTARYHLSTFEQKMMIAICSQIDNEADEFKTVRVKVTDIAEFCGLTGNDKYKRIHQTLIKLMSRTLQLQNEDGKWYVTHWLQSAEYLGGGLIEYCLDNKLKPDFLQLKSTYFSTPAAPLMKFKREYSARFYFIFQKGPKGQAFDLELDFIREIFQLGETYKQFSNIKDRVIEPSLKELNEQSDLQIFHQYIKTGRTYNILRFVVTSKNSEVVTISHKPIPEAVLSPPLEPQTVESLAPSEVAAPPVSSPTPAPRPNLTAEVAPPRENTAQSPKIASEAAKTLGAIPNTQKPVSPPQNENTAASKPPMSDIAQLAARMMNKESWKLSLKMVQKLLKRYGVARVKANLAYAEGHKHPEYTGGCWLIHCIVTDINNKN